jgi:Rrf2 family protein
MTCALRISEAASLAMHAMGLLATDPEGSLSVKAIGARFNVSEAHLSKVLQRLVKVGLLTSVRGPKGGFSLAIPPDRATLLQVFEAIEGPMEPADCLFGVPLCDGESCVLGKVMVEANNLLHEHLATTTLADLSEIFRDERFRIPSSGG